ncbi:MAG: hypothetical protein R3C68_18825 [Myxococcota bacterium]
MARLFAAAGYHVEREYYVNDLGNQIDVFARSIYLRYAELLGRSFVPPEDFYPDTYVTDIAQVLKDEVGERYLDAPESVWLESIGALGVKVMLGRIREDLERFGVEFDRFVSEKELSNRVSLVEVIDRLQAAGHVYNEGGKRWFRSTDFGDLIKIGW